MPSKKQAQASIASPPGRRAAFLAAGLGMLLLAGCDHGLAPPELPPFGTIDAEITYTGPWPSPDSLVDLRFVAFRFLPRDTTDFFRLNEIQFSNTLPFHVDRDRVVLDSVAAGGFVYTVVAQRFSDEITDWRPVGQYLDDGGVFVVAVGETTSIAIQVDFENLPPFPPQ